MAEHSICASGPSSLATRANDSHNIAAATTPTYECFYGENVNKQPHFLPAPSQLHISVGGHHQHQYAPYSFFQQQQQQQPSSRPPAYFSTTASCSSLVSDSSSRLPRINYPNQHSFSSNSDAYDVAMAPPFEPPHPPPLQNTSQTNAYFAASSQPYQNVYTTAATNQPELLVKYQQQQPAYVYQPHTYQTNSIAATNTNSSYYECEPPSTSNNVANVTSAKGDSQESSDEDEDEDEDEDDEGGSDIIAMPQPVGDLLSSTIEATPVEASRSTAAVVQACKRRVVKRASRATSSAWHRAHNADGSSAASHSNSNSSNDDAELAFRRKHRQVYTRQQTFELEKEYCFSKYLSRKRRIEISHSIQLTERQIKIWFQNRRMKEKRDNVKTTTPTTTTTPTAVTTNNESVAFPVLTSDVDALVLKTSPVQTTPPEALHRLNTSGQLVHSTYAYPLSNKPFSHHHHHRQQQQQQQSQHTHNVVEYQDRAILSLGSTYSSINSQCSSSSSSSSGGGSLVSSRPSPTSSFSSSSSTSSSTSTNSASVATNLAI